MIAITGATGGLGRLVMEQLLEKVAADQVVAIVRNPAKAADLKARGVEIRQADYEHPDAYEQALRGIDTLLLISASEVGKRVPQHRNVIEAARKNGVSRLVYTSILGADFSDMMLAREHRATEEMIRDSGMTSTILRNGWYIENYTHNLGPALEHGALLGSGGDGKISAATRGDFAAAAVAVLTTDGHDNKVYDLGGDEAFTLTELAARISKYAGKTIVYRDMPAADYKAALLQAGLPEGLAAMLSDSDEGIRRGDLYTDSGDLRRLIGRPTTSLDDSLAEALAS